MPSNAWLITAAALMTVALPSAGWPADVTTHFTVTGDLEADVQDATASMIRIRKKIPALNVLASPAATKELGATFSVNLFFPNGFEARVGTFPIEFNYRSGPSALGASLVAAGRIFSHDTHGTAEFIEFADQVTVRFEFEVANAREGSTERKLVKIQGEASCPNADIF